MTYRITPIITLDDAAMAIFDAVDAGEYPPPAMGVRTALAAGDEAAAIPHLRRMNILRLSNGDDPVTLNEFVEELAGESP